MGLAVVFGVCVATWAYDNYPSSEIDSDGDGLSDADELSNSGDWPDTDGYITDPDNPDTDGDGISDGDEFTQGTDPTVFDDDVDGDGVADYVEEFQYITNPYDRFD